MGNEDSQGDGDGDEFVIVKMNGAGTGNGFRENRARTSASVEQ
jgi:hypothetical protein